MNESIVLVFGGGHGPDREIKRIDPNAVIIGSHTYPVASKDWKEKNWNKAGFWRELSSRYTKKFCCICVDQGSESWLYNGIEMKIYEFVKDHLTDNGEVHWSCDEV